jgi:hypothetical protein
MKKNGLLEYKGFNDEIKIMEIHKNNMESQKSLYSILNKNQMLSASRS